MQNPKFIIYKGLHDQYYYRLLGANGEIILSSEDYTSGQSCRNGIASVKQNAPLDVRYNRINSPNYRFNLKAANGEIIGRSEIYTTTTGREAGIAAVKKDAPDAPVEYLS